MFDSRQKASEKKKINKLPKSTDFIYSGQQRHISLKQCLVVSSRQQQMVSSYILDAELSVVIKAAKEQMVLSEKIKRKDKQERVRYLIQNQKECEQYQKTYNKYPQINDFLFGRECQNRNMNCILIRCDLISRVHARLKVNAIDSQKKLLQLKLELKAIVKQNRFSSNLHKVPYYLWQNIIQYLKEQSQYTIEDPGSRNGTFLINQSYHFLPIISGQVYQFEAQNYSIKINQILSQKGKSLFYKIEQIEADFDRLSYYRHQYSKKVLYCSDLHKEMLKESQEEMHCLYFQIDYNNENIKYFFIIVARKGLNIGLNVGSGQVIGINDIIERVQYEISLHGYIIFQNNKWFVHPVDQNGYIWTKLPLKIEHVLSKSHNYRFRLGHLNTISLKFHHFQ